MGFGLMFPLNIFSKKNRMDGIEYSLSARLQDIGVRSQSGKSLYQIIHSRRHEHVESSYF
jgi:hypothetical protein